MKILQMNCLYDSGSTGKIVAAIHSYLLGQGDESFVIYGMGKKQNDNNLIRTTPGFVRKIQSFRSRITGYPYGGALWGTINAIHTIEKIKPDIVHLQCPNCYMVNIYKILTYLKDNSIPTVLTNHAEFMYTGGCTHTVDCDKWKTGCYNCNKINNGHPISYFFDRTQQEWKLLKQAYDGFSNLTVCCVSDWVRDRASQSPFFADYPVLTVPNGIDTGVFHYRPSQKIREQIGLKGEKVVLHVTPNFYSMIKGGSHVIEMARRFPDVKFVIVGSEARDDSIPANCFFAGRIDDQSVLAQFYSVADVCLLTSLRETFSMVCAESLCCGTPVVGFRSGGPERISIPQYSIFVDQGNDDELQYQLGIYIEKRNDKQQIAHEAQALYGQEAMCKNYYSIYKAALNNV